MIVSRSGIWAWIIQRVSAVFLVVGLIVHYLVVHYAIERPVNYAKVFERLSHPVWIIFDTLLLMAVVYHALNGVFMIFLDFGIKERAKTALAWILWILGIATFIIGFYILLPFGHMTIKL